MTTTPAIKSNLQLILTNCIGNPNSISIKLYNVFSDESHNSSERISKITRVAHSLNHPQIKLEQPNTSLGENNEWFSILEKIYAARRNIK